jgi:hypothetical protein
LQRWLSHQERNFSTGALRPIGFMLDELYRIFVHCYYARRILAEVITEAYLVQ